MAKRKSAKDSLAKLSKGLARETPATRAQEEQPEQAESPRGVGDYGEDSTPDATTNAAPAAAPSATPGTEGMPGRSPRSTGRPRTKTQKMVRVSVDLPRPEHKYLRDFAYDAESDGMSVMRALLLELRDNEELAGQVQNRLDGFRAGSRSEEY